MKPYNKEEVMKVWRGKFKCINTDCSGEGAIPHQVAEDEWEAEQCQYCYEIRFPVFELLSTALDAAYKAGEDARNMKIHKTIVDLPYPRDMYVARHRSEILAAIEALK